ncbi:hypothetical protein SAMN02910298_01548 [Pseudobutyrivibrio sp. YE44]|uniref:hypothetical protein n=1 Tax=Pseudobutyrivibrio sp. YE44 TaxID=1520802 RepID=UPI00088D7296|nr:hypothetical protein [Pseudobutyrivibrio sp. YE44]SDB31236.1 hypothetical protein SAMN02910298_01548 [Pseudobutyrivibrio sp. YE44]
MSNLSKRAAKYYFLQGIKFIVWVILIQGFLFAEWLVIGGDPGESALEHATDMLFSIGGFMTIFLNGMFSLYGPNWYDSMALSMGARRKDIFWGQIIKQFTFVIGATLCYVIVALVSGQTSYLLTIVVEGILAIAAGPIGQVIGYKIKRFGKIAVLFMAIIGGSFGAAFALQATGVFVFEYQSISIALIAVVVLVVFALFEMWVYKLNSKLMVH